MMDSLIKFGRKNNATEILQRYTDILGMIPYLPKTISTAEIHKRLSRGSNPPTLRTIQRNLADLTLLYPITSATLSDKTMQWHWMENCTPQVFGIGIDMALALKFVNEYISELLPRNVQSNIQALSDASVKALSLESAKQLAEWSKKVKILHKGPVRLPPVIAAPIQKEVYQALLTDKQLSVTYLAAGNTEPKKSIVNPLGLISKEGFLYVVVGKSSEEPPYLLALHRIQQAETLLSSCVVPLSWSGLAQFIAEGKMAFPPSLMIFNVWVTLRVAKRTAQNLKEMPFAGDQTVIDDGDFCTITAKMTISEELVRWLLQFGSSVEVIEPALLRGQMKEVVDDLAKLYIGVR